MKLGPTLKHFFTYQKIGFVFDLKQTMAYPASFWLAMLVFPLWSVVSILFVEAIYGQTETFLGYTKYQMYVMFGSYRIVSNFSYFLVLKRLYDLKNLIRGNSQETFDMVLLKPVDTQVYGTTGRFSFYEFSQLFVGFALIAIGISKENVTFSPYNIFAYLILIICAVVLMYCVYLFLRCLIFWFQEFEVSEGLFETFRGFGKYPPELYQGSFGLLFNIIFPVTLTGGIPAAFLYGRIPWYLLFFYIGIVTLIFYLTRKFWQLSIKKYTSFSS